MTKLEANKLLDYVRGGADVPEQQIVDALITTGDMEACAYTHVIRPAGTWQSDADKRAKPAHWLDALAA